MEKEYSHTVILIPVYQPQDTLIRLCGELAGAGFFRVVVVDDGSGEDYAHIFSALMQNGCTVLTHAINLGKGCALKTGMNHILAEMDGVSGVVTADADGQHLVADISRVADTLAERKDTIVLGSRRLKGKVPLKSRLGNTITRGVFRFVSGQKIFDTQTGLRGMPASALEDLLELKGARYEYEMNVLLEARNLGLRLEEIDIETVYIDGNRTSHFKALADSWRIYRQIFMFVGSSMIAFIVDYALFALLSLLIGEGVVPIIVARVISSLVNFMINRNVIFFKKEGAGFVRHIVGYYLLAGAILLLNLLLMWALNDRLGVNWYAAMVITQVILYPVSFLVQKRVIFR